MNKMIQRIEHIDRIRKCYIMYGNEAVGELIEETSSISGEEDWVIKPYHDVIERLGWRAELPGIDKSLRKEEYIRRGKPVIVRQRVIPAGRGDLDAELKRLGLNEYDVFEMMCRNHAVCGNNKLYIARTPQDVIDADSIEDRLSVAPSPDNYEELGWLY